MSFFCCRTVEGCDSDLKIGVLFAEQVIPLSNSDVSDVSLWAAGVYQCCSNHLQSIKRDELMVWEEALTLNVLILNLSSQILLILPPCPTVDYKRDQKLREIKHVH